MKPLVLILALFVGLVGCTPAGDGRAMSAAPGAHPAPTVRGFWWQTAICSPVDDCWPAPR